MVNRNAPVLLEAVCVRRSAIETESRDLFWRGGASVDEVNVGRIAALPKVAVKTRAPENGFYVGGQQECTQFTIDNKKGQPEPIDIRSQ